MLADKDRIFTNRHCCQPPGLKATQARGDRDRTAGLLKVKSAFPTGAGLYEDTRQIEGRTVCAVDRATSARNWNRVSRRRTANTYCRRIRSKTMPDRNQMRFDILLGVQNDLGLIKCEQTSQGLRLSSIEDHIRGTMTSIYGIQSDVADVKLRVDRIEKRLGLNETEQ